MSPYSRNPKTVENWKAYLDQLVKAKETREDLTWPSTNTHMLGYYIRQAMNVAKAQKIAPYETLKDEFIIRDRGDRIVAELRSRTPLESLRAAPIKLVLETLSTLPEVVGACINHKASEMYFPDADLSTEERAILHQWAAKNEYYLIFGDGVSVTRTDPGELAWVPGDE